MKSDQEYPEEITSENRLQTTSLGPAEYSPKLFATLHQSAIIPSTANDQPIKPRNSANHPRIFRAKLQPNRRPKPPNLGRLYLPFRRHLFALQPRPESQISRLRRSRLRYPKHPHPARLRLGEHP